MSGFLFSFLAVLLAGIGARDQLLVATLSARQGARPMVLIAALVCAMASGALVAWLAGIVLPRMGPAQRQMFAALALGLAAMEMLLSRKARLPNEPTHSLFAFAVVLFAQQLTDAARFLIFAIAAATSASIAAGLGGMVGGAGVVVGGWLGADLLLKRNLAPLRRVIGLVLLMAAAWIGLNARLD